MQKKILALAVAAAVSAPAFAAEATVTVYGKAFASLDNLSSDKFGAAAPGVSHSIMGVHSNASRLGFKGEEDLGNGLKAIYQYEAEFNLDGNSTGGGNGAFLATRNSNIGLAGGFGTVFMGNWDTPYKLAHNPIELNDNTTFGSQTNVVGRFNGAGTSLNTRLKDSVAYWSPVIAGGLQIKAAYGFDDAKSPAAPAGTGSNQTVYSLSATYDTNLFYAGVAVQNHNDTNGLTGAGQVGSKVSGTRLVGDYKFGTNGFVGVMYEQMKTTVVAVGDASRTALEVAGKYAFGAHSIGAAYVKANAQSGAASTPASSATQLTVRYGYAMSKATEVYALFTQLKNGTAGTYNFSAGNGTAMTSQPGATLGGLGVGMIHSF